MKLCDIGIIGLSVMGRSLALNMADHGFCVAGYNRSRSVTEAVVLEHPHPNLMPFYTLESFVSALKRPRRVMLMIQAGAPVDAVIDQLLPLLATGDILLDGGNSFLKTPDGEAGCFPKKASNTLALAFPAERKAPAAAPPSCRAAMRTRIPRCSLFSNPSRRPRSKCHAVPISDRMVPDIM